MPEDRAPRLAYATEIDEKYRESGQQTFRAFLLKLTECRQLGRSRGARQAGHGDGARDRAVADLRAAGALGSWHWFSALRRHSSVRDWVIR